jgi:hypothetical protein
LNVIQQQLVKETAEALARQLADSSGQNQGAAAGLVVPNAPQPSVQVQKEDMPRAGSGVQRTEALSQQRPSAEASLLAVAGVTNQASRNSVEPAPSVGDNAAGSKKKGPTCYRCGKSGHCLNECEVILCDCC